MAVESGLGLTVTVDDSTGSGRAIAVTNLTFGIPSNTQDVTATTQSGMARLLLLADIAVSISGVFDDGANLSHAVFKNYRTLAASQLGRTTAIAHSGQTLTAEVLYSDYALTRAADGSLTWTAPGNNGDGVVPAWS